MAHQCTPRTQANLIAQARKGATNRDACAILGIPERTLYEWLARKDLTEFADAYAQARAESRQRSVQLIADSDDWRAHAWLLERVDPKHWGKAELQIGALETALAAYLKGHNDATADTKDSTNADAEI